MAICSKMQLLPTAFDPFFLVLHYQPFLYFLLKPMASSDKPLAANWWASVDACALC